MLRCAARHATAGPHAQVASCAQPSTVLSAICAALVAEACAVRRVASAKLYTRAIATMPDLAVSATGHESTGKQTQGVIGTSAAWLCLCRSGTAAAKSNTLPSEHTRALEAAQDEPKAIRANS